MDDNAATRRMVKNALARNGHHVIEAEDGRSALELMRRERPRVVLQDLMLPDIDGFTLVGELRELVPEASILAFSGFVSKLDEARISTVGFDDIIPKPIAPSRLVPLVEAHLPAPVPVDERFGTGRRLVIADDDPMQLKLAQFRLSRLGFAVDAFPDGAAALAAAERAIPDAIVSDVMMPNLDGFGLAMAVRRDPKLARIPLLLVTSSYVEPSDRELAQRAGANDLVVRTPELVEVIELLRVTLTAPTRSPIIEASALDELERERSRRVMRQLERQVMLNTGLSKRCSVLASELTVLTGISEAVLKHRDVDVALDEALATCFDAGGVAVGALYLLDDKRQLRVRGLGDDPVWNASDLASFFGHEALLREVIDSGKSLHLPGATDVPRAVAAKLLDHCQGNALQLAPLAHVGGPLGALLMVARGRELDPEDWRAFAQGLATQVGQVLTLAKAYEDREAAERRAEEHAALLGAMVESAPDIILHVAVDGTILFANKAIAGVPADKLPGKSFFELPNNDNQNTIRSEFERVVGTGQAGGYEVNTSQVEDTASWYSVRLGPAKRGDHVVAIVVVARDISDQKRTEMQLMLADRMASVGTLAAGVAHEINNPLASVIANLDMAKQDLEELATRVTVPKDLPEELHDARTSADRVREIVRDLKIFSRAQEDSRGAVDVEHVLDSTLRMAWNELRHRAKIVKTYGKVPRVDANESRLGQVFLNLIVNAAQAIPEGNYERNQVRISTKLVDGNVMVSIADTGSGIPADVRRRLFTPFFTTKPIGVGTGLGLAISHRIVIGLGGSIEVESEVGKGTEFRVVLPVTSGLLAPPTQEIPVSKVATRRGRVLVIDDEETLAQAMRRYLALEHEVEAMTSARTALDLIEAGQRFDVILCDVMMPNITGMDFHTTVRALEPALAERIVFVTGGAFTQTAREFLDRVSNRRIEKPFDLKALRALVNEMIR
ncbi:MAG TPA: response regulator [Kofleriaceae bacterium]